MSKKVHLLDYVAGNIRSLVNAIEKCGYDVEWIKSPEDVKNAEVRDFYSSAMHDKCLQVSLFIRSAAKLKFAFSLKIARSTEFNNRENPPFLAINLE